MSEMTVPDGWESISLGELGNTFNGLTKKTAKDFGRGQYFLTYMQVFKNTLSNRSQCDSVEIIEGEKQSQVQYGDILFTTSSETPEEIGYTSVFLEKDWFPYLNSFCFGIRPTTNNLSPEYANYLFRGDEFRTAIQPLAQGSTRFNLSKENLKKLIISFPPLPEQQKIASILTSVDDVIEKTQSQINKLQDLKKGTMNELLTKGIGHTEFVDSPVGKIPKGWELKSLGKHCKFTQGVQISLDETLRHSEKGYIRYLYINDFSNDNRLKYVKDNYPTKIVTTDDLVMANTGHTAGTVFKGKYGVLSNNAFKISVDKKYLTNEYLYYFLISDEYKIEIGKLFNSAGQPHVGHGNIAKLKMRFPSVEEQLKMASILSSIDKNIEEKKRKLEQTKSLKKSLMQDLLTGKVRVS